MRDDDLIRAALKQIADTGFERGQLYRHCETRTIYVITDVGLNEPDLEPLVHYRNAADENAIIWTRQLHVFGGHKIVNGTLVKRYDRVFERDV